ncbi:hypothetical protein GCM10012284_48980 [Mangrovihabitans endophyticus]|uniref:Protein kinase domain-containing protein n=1 Tax=Mangrovihabitans endophyticus TaxID=1751298 RepID=A0A8J3FRD6_9ACTN|nr:hypothetical protein GCM10012284_48980 [Mangrovihabitans endophyticus]
MSTSPPLVVADRYRLVAPLGQGGMGRVWRATDVVLHRDVAIKELVPPPGLTPDERREMRERSLREARAIARLNNINVVRVFDVLRTDADPWIVMEYVPSRSLQDTLASDGTFPPVRTAEIGLGVLNALRAAHRAGVVHRDVKPGNVLIGADGRVVLTDFGLATVPGDPNVTRTGLVLGSPAYIAPERARDGTAGPAADLWSLGATLYAAVEGASPFARPSAIATLAALATENPPPARHAGPLKPVLNGLLRKDPSHRINAEEAERLLLRATGRRSKLSFPMSSTMRRPGAGRDRASTPATPPVVPGSGPVVPGPRPPATPRRPTARGAARPPVYVPGKAAVGRPADAPQDGTSTEAPKTEAPKVEARALDSTRVDGTPVREGREPAAKSDTAKSDTVRGRSAETRMSAPTSAPTPEAPSADRSPAQGTAQGKASAAFGALSAADLAAARRARRAAADQQPGAAGQVARGTAAIKPGAADAQDGTAEAQTSDKAGVAGSEKAGVAGGAGSDVGEIDADEPSGESAREADDAAGSSSGRGSEPESDGPGTAEARDVEDDAHDAVAASAKTTPPNKPTVGARAGTGRSKAARKKSRSRSSAPTTGATETGAKETGAKETGAKETGATETGATDAGTGPSKGDSTAPDPTAADSTAVGPEVRDAEMGGAKKERSGSDRTGHGGPIVEANATEAEANATEAEATPTEATATNAAEADAAAADAAEADDTPGAEAPAGTPEEAGTPEDVDPAGGIGKNSITRATAEGATQGSAGQPAAITAAKVAGAKAAAAALPTGPDATRRPMRPPMAAAVDAGASGTVPPAMSHVPPSRRPAWQPMRFPERREPRGVTVFGTTLTRRQAIIGLLIVLAVILTLGLVVPLAFAADDRTPGAAAPVSSGAAQQSGAVTDSTANEAAEPAETTATGPASTAAQSAAAQPATDQPTTSQPTSVPAEPSGGGGGVELPDGWYFYKDGTGFSVPVPRGWRVSHRGSEVWFTDNSGKGRLLIVDQTRDPKPDPVQDWTKQEAQRSGGYRDYRLLGIRGVAYWDKAADWEFLRTSDRGNRLHVVKRGFITAPDQAYGISWSTSADDWDANKAALDLIYRGFKPAR